MHNSKRHFNFLHQRKPVASKIPLNRGFTLIELMVTLAIAAIVLSIGIPSFKNIIKENNQATLLNEFTSYVNFAKSTAVTQGAVVVLCPRNTAGTDCNSSGSWDDGWIVFVDSNEDGDKDNGDTLLKVHESIDDDFNITTSSTSVEINAKGFVSANSTFTFCDSRGSNYAVAKILSKTGRMSSSTDSLTCS